MDGQIRCHLSVQQSLDLYAGGPAWGASAHGAAGVGVCVLPPPRRPRVFPAPRLDLVRVLVDGVQRKYLDAPRKQRHAARQVLARQVDEHQVTDVTYSTVREYVRVRRPEILAEAGSSWPRRTSRRCTGPGRRPRSTSPTCGWSCNGVKTKVFLFTFRLSYPGKAVHRAYGAQGQEAFLDGHLAAGEALGGVPTRHAR